MTRFVYKLVLLFCLSGLMLAQASPYSFSTRQELVMLGSGITLNLAGFWADASRSGATSSALAALNKRDVPWFDRWVAGNWDPAAQRQSDALLALGTFAPLGLMLTDNAVPGEVSLMYLQTILFSNAGILLSKGLVKRYRPFTYGDAAPVDAKLHKDATRSFFSGHAAATTAGLVFSAKVYADYQPESRWRPYAWGGAITGSLLVSYLRMKGGKHFLSDVALGMLWGAGAGYVVPHWHRKGNADTQIMTSFSAGVPLLGFYRRF